jgi:hypothetical protein
MSLFLNPKLSKVATIKVRPIRNWLINVNILMTVSGIRVVYCLCTLNFVNKRSELSIFVVFLLCSCEELYTVATAM